MNVKELRVICESANERTRRKIERNKRRVERQQIVAIILMFVIATIYVK